MLVIQQNKTRYILIYEHPSPKTVHEKLEKRPDEGCSHAICIWALWWLIEPVIFVKKRYDILFRLHKLSMCTGIYLFIVADQGKQIISQYRLPFEPYESMINIHPDINSSQILLWSIHPDVYTHILRRKHINCKQLCVFIEQTTD
jgi:hypothetical protein